MSPLIDCASGSAGSVTATGNQHGRYFIDRPVITAPPTALQTEYRNRFANIMQLWYSALSKAQRQAWNDYAEMAPIHDVDGICPRKTKLTGVLHFARWNLASIRYHQTIKVTAPTTPEPAQRPHARVEYRKDPAGPTLYTQFRLFFDTSDQWAQITGTVNPNTGYLLFAISPVQTSAINFYKREYTRLRVVSYNNTSPIHLRGFLALQDNHKYFAVARALIGDGRCTDRFTIPCERT